ncbi:winged helix DNA-binding domain-containing protein [Kineosporia succinea]|uniref:Winged helix DNA-binding protein n=1 Tax=Kineosporia succinea TaxID=84632 RepID=A0ABT9NXC8_9ACTN|nr:winged helix DNA-binding domain-containing protein [Kineosporia succinea]MDP9825086.1 hypothetical protein [Kineosporia succinea]
MRLVTDEERRSRLAVRHALAPAQQADSPEAVTRALTALHSTEPASPYLSCWARMPRVEVAEVDRALHDDRSLVKQLAMRRTLFVFPRDLLPAVWPSASARVAATERSRMAKDVVRTGLADDGEVWLDAARAEVLDVLARTPDGLTAAQIREAVPRIAVKVQGTSGETWSGPRVLTQLGASADVVRGRNTGRWNVSRPLWTLTPTWLGDLAPLPSAADGYRELVRRWLYSFGPGTESDLVWWLGSTRAAVRTALRELGALEVRLEDASVAYLLPDDEDVVPGPGDWAALLPVLDPTVMGWQGRGFYLGPHKDRLFDTRGNVGTSAWVNGRMVGCWVQDDAGTVTVRLVEDVSPGARQSLDAAAARLTEWLDGLRIGTVYRSPAMS